MPIDKIGPNEVPDISHSLESDRPQRLRSIRDATIQAIKGRVTVMSELRPSRRQRPLRVFVSHSTVDIIFARKLGNLLGRRLNAQVFTTEDLSAGERWETKLRNELAATDVLVALLTLNSVHSSWVLHEIGAAWALKKPIIPVVTRRDVLNNMPIPLEGANVIELADVESDANADKFVDAFEDSLAAVHIA